MALLKFPEGVSSVSYNGVPIPVADDGTADVPADSVPLMCGTFGAKVVKPRPAPAPTPTPTPTPPK